jgi:hypothetical protein
MQHQAAARQMTVHELVLDIIGQNVSLETKQRVGSTWQSDFDRMNEFARLHTRHLPAGYQADDTRETIYAGRDSTTP